MLLLAIFLLLIHSRHYFCIILNQPSSEESPQSLIPLWKNNIRMNLYVFINSEARFNDYKATPNWKVSIINQQQEYNLLNQLLIPKNPQVHQYYAHIFLVKDTFSINPDDKTFSTDSVVYVCHSLTKFYDHENKGQLQPYWHDTVTISLLHESKNYIRKDRIHPLTLNYFLRNLDKKHTKTRAQNVGFYRPIVFPNDFWLVKKDAYLLNNTASILPLTIRLETINLWKFNIYAVLANNNEPTRTKCTQQSKTITSFFELENTKNFMMTSNQAYTMTLLNCLLNALFEFLAFKNDISFWRKKSNGIGVSFYSLIIALATRVALFTSTTNISKNPLSCFTHIFHISVEMWKIHRMLTFKYECRISCFSIKVFSQTKNKMIQQGEERTRQLDNIMARYLVLFTPPLFVLYHLYNPQSASNCWTRKLTAAALTDYILVFGPLMAIGPQLYMNSQLNMINHTSFRTIMYKSLNVILDDIFALMIHMPPLYHILNAKNNFIYILYILQKAKYTAYYMYRRSWLSQKTYNNIPYTTK